MEKRCRFGTGASCVRRSGGKEIGDKGQEVEVGGGRREDNGSMNGSAHGAHGAQTERAAVHRHETATASIDQRLPQTCSPLDSIRNRACYSLSRLIQIILFNPIDS